MYSDQSSLGGSKKLLADAVFEHIGAQIVDGSLPAGHRIRDVDLAAEMHVSRTPVREALQRLERLGLVTMYPSRYTEVTAVTPEMVEQAREFAGYQAGVAARMAVPRLTEQEREHVAALADDLSAAHDDEDAHPADARWRLFAYLSDHSGNAQHEMLLGDARLALLRNLRAWEAPASDGERVQDIGRRLGEAVRRGDGDEAERLARAVYGV
ncbi:GntR family transcriptional regulator [Microbacterium sp. SD291]|uniref:GntR family transcriptional regulator n=1 Tax=Microbacterium sp. SD291 TaxID=2782007 RepID=UPI001A979FBB|nr:GntR family transcriptional regulator [Microbacterium sp. SD291]MBO0980408.1 GntR family transcriptional regulator [Microbacterium sp. SD291]